jgi:ATPase family associated with various cellular activities (AAA)
MFQKLLDSIPWWQGEKNTPPSPVSIPDVVSSDTASKATRVLDVMPVENWNSDSSVKDVIQWADDSLLVLNRKSFTPMDTQARDILLNHIQKRYCKWAQLQEKKIFFPKGTDWKSGFSKDSILIAWARSGLVKISDFSDNIITFGKLMFHLDFGYNWPFFWFTFQDDIVNESDVRDCIKFLDSVVFPKVQVMNLVSNSKEISDILCLQDDELLSFDNNEKHGSVSFPFSFSQSYLERIVLEELVSLFWIKYGTPEISYTFLTGTYVSGGVSHFSLNIQRQKTGENFTLNFFTYPRAQPSLTISFELNSPALSAENLQKIIWKLFARLRVEGSRDSKNTSISALDKLRATGIKVSMPDNDNIGNLDALRKKYGFVWRDELFEQLQQDIIDPLKNPEKYLRYQQKFEHASLIPNAALMYGPPGNGKTTFAQILGNYIGCPFVYIPVATMFTKWLWDTENNFNTAFVEAGNLAKEYGRVIVMIDEIDEVGGDRNRDQSSHGTQQKVTGIILKKLEWFEQIPNMFFFWATNRKDALDPALLSRFQTQIEFTDPNPTDAKKILWHYLNSDLTALPDGLFEDISSRDLRGFGNSFLRFCAQSDKDIDTLQEEVLLQLVTTRLQVARRLTWVMPN